MSDIAWLIQRDFNTVMFDADRMGWHLVNELTFEEIHDRIMKTNLSEIRIVGLRFT